MRTVLFIIESDPRLSGKPAEAVRMASGLGAWKKVDAAIYLRGAAVLVLSEDAGEWVDGENYARYLPALKEAGQAVYAQKGAAALSQLGQASLPFEEISDEQLAEVAAARDGVLRF